jgi:SAM-dependent methyltransferase
VGCGEGAAALWLAQRFPGARVHGVDIDADAVRACAQRAAHGGLRNIKFSTANLETLKYAGKFDFVYSIHVLEYAVDDGKAVGHLAQSLQSGGLLLVTVVEPRLGGDPNFGFRRFLSSDQRDLETGRERIGYSYPEMRSLMLASGLQVLGFRYTMAPPALLAHTGFEVLRHHHLRWYMALLPFLRLIGYSDLLLPWRSGAALTVWARKP